MSKIKAIVLLSGGLDSVVLAHYVAIELHREIYPIFFNYGQPTLEIEKECAKKCIESIQSSNIYIHPLQILPYMPLVAPEEGSEYVPQRNFIFIAHASMLAEKVGITEIYAGFIDPERPNKERYPDASPDFVARMNNLLHISNQELVAPFIDNRKWDIFCMARDYGIELCDTWSCNLPNISWDLGFKEISPCGKCGNCIIRSELDNAIIAWGDGGLEVSPKFESKFMQTNVYEVRIAINNKCNMTCKHCFYGFTETTRPDLTFEQFTRAIDDFVANGVTQFHFSGKEPFFDDYIFKFTDYLKEKHPHVRYDAVTNGINVPKYINQIKSAGFYRICVSFDDFDGGKTRDYDSSEVMKLLMLNGIETHAFMTCSKANVDQFMNNLESLNCMGVRDFCVNFLHTSGRGKEIIEEVLTVDDMCNIYSKLRNTELDVEIITKISGSNMQAMINKGYEEFTEDTATILQYGTCNINNKFAVWPEFYCNRYSNTVTLTSDGYVLGCALEVTADYDTRSIGNVLDHPVADLIRAGKVISLRDLKARQECANVHECGTCSGECQHEKFCYNLNQIVEY